MKFIRNPHIDLLMNCMKIYLFDDSTPNPSSRPLNTQLLLEISIRIQWKTSQTKLKSPKKVIMSLTPIPLRGQLCICRAYAPIAMYAVSCNGAEIRCYSQLRVGSKPNSSNALQHESPGTHHKQEYGKHALPTSTLWHGTDVSKAQTDTGHTYP